MQDRKNKPQVGHGQTERRGMAVLDEVVNKPQAEGGLGFLFRELSTSDYGLDGQIEVVEAIGEQVEATGKIVSVQVKSGSSYLRPATGDDWVVRIKESTVEYWKSHSVPVLLVVVDIGERVCYWVRGDTDGHEEAGEYRKVRVPKSNVLDRRAAWRVVELANNTTVVERRLAALEADLPLIGAALGDGVVAMDLMLWVNKTSGRTDYHVGLRDWDIVDTEPRFMKSFSRGSALGSRDISKVAAYIVPWADPVADPDSYELLGPDRDELYEQYLSEYGTWDNEDGIYVDALGEFPGWLKERRGRFTKQIVEPYEDTPETEHFRLRLVPNKLARAFPIVYRHLKGISKGASESPSDRV